MNFITWSIWKSFAAAYARLPYARLQRLARPGLVVMPFYHLVSDEPRPEVQHLFTFRTAAQFRRDLDFYLERYRVIDLKTLLAGRFDGPALHLTFDDGLRDACAVAAPIMSERGLSATFFLNPEFLDNRSMCYRHKASLLIERIGRGLDDRQRLALGDVLGCEDHADRHLRRALLAISYRHRGRLDEAALLVGVDFSAYLREHRPYMTSAEVDELLKQGHTVGAHSMDHPYYPELSLDEQIEQTEESMRFLDERFHPASRVFAFPFEDDGVSPEFFRRIWGRGIEAVFGVAGMMEDEFPRSFQRVCMDNLSGEAESILRFQYARQRFKEIIRKGRIQRVESHAI